MEVVICPDADRAQALTARLIAERLAAHPASVLGLATGRTMEGVYARLAGMGASLSRATTFNLDEYVGVPPDDPRSYAAYMAEHLFSKTGADPSRTHLPDGMADDLAAAAADYEARIATAGGIDLQLLGIGSTGHIGFNEPISSLRSRTRDKLLTQATRDQNAGMWGGDPDAVPKRAMTMGVGTILDASALVLLGCGTAKAEVVAQAIEGPITSRISASAIQMHNACTVILDRDAAAALSGRAYYDFVTENEPRWDAHRDLL